MADVWISRKRWTCKYCDVTINDDLPSRRHHETGLRHKQNKQKALQELYRKSEQERKDAEHTKKEMERIEALAAESYAKDQASGNQSIATPLQTTPAPSTSSLQPTKHVQATSQSSPARRHRQVTGEVEREAHQPTARAGEWEEVAPSRLLQQFSSASASQSAETSDRERAKSFRMREKVAQLEDSDDDLAESTIKIRKRPRTDASNEKAHRSLEPSAKLEEQARVTSPVKKEADASSFSVSSQKPQADAGGTSLSDRALKKEEEGEDLTASLTTKEEGQAGTGGDGGLFKKRRAGAGAGAKRVKAVI